MGGEERKREGEKVSGCLIVEKTRGWKLRLERVGKMRGHGDGKEKRRGGERMERFRDEKLEGWTKKTKIKEKEVGGSEVTGWEGRSYFFKKINIILNS